LAIFAVIALLKLLLEPKERKIAAVQAVAWCVILLGHTRKCGKNVSGEAGTGSATSVHKIRELHKTSPKIPENPKKFPKLYQTSQKFPGAGSFNFAR
jgi:hypothetical protein